MSLALFCSCSTNKCELDRLNTNQDGYKNDDPGDCDSGNNPSTSVANIHGFIAFVLLCEPGLGDHPGDSHLNEAENDTGDWQNHAQWDDDGNDCDSQ